MEIIALFQILAALSTCGLAKHQRPIVTPRTLCVCVNESSLPKENICDGGCKSLEKMSSGDITSDSTTVTFYPGTHVLNRSWKITRLRNITLKNVADTQEKVEIFCPPASAGKAGIQFSDCAGVVLSDIQISGCGIYASVHAKMTNHTVISALVFARGTDIELRNLNVTESIAAGMAIIDVTGRILVEGSSFSDATISEKYKKFDLNGNFIGYNNNNTKVASVQIKDTRFERNKYAQSYKCRPKDDKRLSAGLSVVLSHGNVTISLSRVIMDSNGGCAGGNMAVILFNMHELVNSTQISIDDGSIIANGRGNVGGGIFVTLLVNSEENPGNVHAMGIRGSTPLTLINITDTTFSNNVANFVGGAIYLKQLEAYRFSSPGVVNITRCLFVGNGLTGRGSGGMAFHMTTFIVREQELHERPQLKVAMSSCNFTKHLNSETRKLGRAVIFVKMSPYLGLEDVRVWKNKCTGLLAISSNVVVSGDVVLTNNTAVSGGGMLLCASAVLYLVTGARLSITRNRAMTTGGGINVERECTINRPKCFFQYASSVVESQTNVSITVQGNHASQAGDEIYGGSVEDCYLLNVSQGSPLRSFSVFQKIFNITRDVNKELKSLVSSAPQKVCLVGKHDKVNCSFNETEVYPGETLQLNVVVHGQLKGTVPGTVYAELKPSNIVKLQKHQEAQLVPKKGKQRLSFRIYSKKENINATLSLRVMQASGPGNTLTIALRVRKCPLGYSLPANPSTQSHCSCDALRRYVSNRSKLTCDISRHRRIHYKRPVWMGIVKLPRGGWNSYHHDATLSRGPDDRLALSKTCPRDYCDLKTNHIDLDSPSDVAQCYFKRQGILCGGCMENHSLLLGSSRCKEDCSNSYLLLLVVFALGGVALVFFLTFLNLTVSEGIINGLVFYANVVEMYDFFIFEENSRDLSPFLKVFMAWLNLDLGIETCFYIGMDGFAKSLLQFAFPLYIWLIAGVIVYLSKRYATVMAICGENSVKVLATLVLLSYSKILQAVTNSLHFTPIHLFGSSNNSSSNDITIHYYLQWTMDGRITYLQGKHIMIFTVGLVFCVGCSLPFMLTLLCIQNMGRVSNWPCFSWVHRLKPFFDTYMGPLTDRARFWVGLLLLLRILIMAVYSVNYNNTDAHVMAFVVLVCLLLLLAASCLPKGVYKKQWLNVLEQFFIANLGFMFLGLLCSIYYSSTIMKRCVVQVSIGLAFLAFLLIVGHQVSLKPWCRRLLRWLKRKCRHCCLHCDCCRRQRCCSFCCHQQDHMGSSSSSTDEAGYGYRHHGNGSSCTSSYSSSTPGNLRPMYLGFNEDREPLLTNIIDY